MNFVATMIPFGIFFIAVACLGIYLTVLVIKALRKYLSPSLSGKKSRRPPETSARF